MAYILYIPNTECGPSTYTQRSFETLRDLARWSMEQALGSALPPAPMPVTPAELASVTPEPALLLQQSTSLEELDISASPTPIEKKPLSYYVSPTYYVESTETESTRYIEGLIMEEKWGELAKVYSHRMPFLSARLGTSAPENILSSNEIEFIAKLLYRHPDLFDLSPTMSKYDTSKFPSIVEETLIALECDSETKIFETRNFMVNHSLRIYRILNNFIHHYSWMFIGYPSVNTPVFRKTLETFSADDIIKICLAWIREEEPTDSMKEFIISLYTVQNYKCATRSTTHIGSAQFLTTYLSKSSQEYSSLDCTAGNIAYVNLPLEFRIWAAAGVSHSLCTSALEKLGVAKIRRAEGQRYIGLEEITGESTTIDYHSLQNVSWKQPKEKPADLEPMGSDICGGLSSYLSPIN